MPVEPLEHQLAEVIEARLFQQRQTDSTGEAPRQRLGVVVEVDQQGLAEARLDEAVGVAVEVVDEWLVGQEMTDVGDDGFTLEVGDRAGLGGGHVGGVADDEDVGCGAGLQGVLVGRHEVQRVAEAWRATDELGSTVQRHDDCKIERHLATVVRHEPATFAVDLAGVELGDQLDALLFQHAAELSGRDRHGEGRVERRHVRE